MNLSLFDAHHRCNGFGTARRSNQMADHRFGGAYGDFVCPIAQCIFNGFGFNGVVKFCRSAMGIDVVDFLGLDFRFVECHFYGLDERLPPEDREW